MCDTPITEFNANLLSLQAFFKRQFLNKTPTFKLLIVQNYLQLYFLNKIQ